MLKVQRLLTEEDLNVRLTADGLVIPFDTTAVFVRVIEQNTRTLIAFQAPMVIAAPDTPELTRWVATDGQMYFFGSARLNPNDDGTADVVLEHTLLGDYLDRDELHSVVAALASTADGLDEDLTEQFGGHRLSDVD
jgi:hypothetical protein